MTHAAGYQFTRAITRRPGPEAVHGLRAVDTGPPDPELMLRHHADYVAALRDAGVTVTELAPLAGQPDAQFVEDTALCLPQGAVLLRPGAAARQGEVAPMAATLAADYGDLRHIPGPGTVEGGDILFTGTEILVGRSARTDAAGIRALEACLADWGHPVREVATPPGVLHFKTDCALVGPGLILATERLAAAGCFAGYDVLTVPEDEAPAANCIRVNDTVLVPSGFARTRAVLVDAGLEVREIGNSECAKLDGGMSCLSLRF
jgi:dimethylargininase